MRSALVFTIAAVSLVGCAAPINVRNAEVHAQAGYAAQQRGDWDAAMRQFAQAVVNADLGGAEPRGRAIVNYEYGRALGVSCRYSEAEKYLLRSKEFDEKQGRSPYLPLYELGLISEKQGNSLQAANYFSQLIPLMEKEGLRSRYPLGVADAYDRYASALQTNGDSEKASIQRGEANKIRAANPGAARFGTVTPYGSACPTGS